MSGAENDGRGRPSEGQGVSVVIPSYNGRDFVMDAVRSALDQTVPPREVIVIDDGSSDGTAAVFEDPPDGVTYVRQENAGVSAARNHGARLAGGEWLAFLDADDLWEPDKTAATLAALEAFPDARWAFTLCSLMDASGRPRPGGIERVCPAFERRDEPPVDVLDGRFRREEVDVEGERFDVYGGDFYEFLFSGNAVIPSSSLVRKDFFREIGMFDEGFRYSEETEFFHRAAARAPGVCVAAPLLRYRTEQATSLTAGSNTPVLVRNALESIERAVKLRPEVSKPVQERYDRARIRLLAKLAYSELSCLNPREARRQQLRAWKAGAPATPRSVGVLLASFLPPAGLRLMHRLKRWRGAGATADRG